MKKVLIIGGFGYVGSQLLTLIHDRKDLEITVVDNLMSGEALSWPRVLFLQADIRDYARMQHVIRSQDVIILLAGIVGEPSCVIDSAFSFDINVRAVIDIVSMIRPDQRLIFTSTSSVYGDRSGEVVTELSEPKPINHYSVQKMIAEQAIRERIADYIIVRPVTAFGVSKRMRLDLLVNTMIYDALTKGKITVYEPDIIRPMIHVIDFARILEYALDDHLSAREVYNIGDPSLTVTKQQLAEKISEITGAQVIPSNGTSLDLRNYYIQFNKLLSTGFTFLPDRLELAVMQIRYTLSALQANENLYYSPNIVKKFLKESYGIYGTY